MTFEAAFKNLMPFEGGSKLHTVAGDTGGTTKWGVSQRAFPDINIAELTEEDAMEIYRKNYWEPCKCDNIDCKLQYSLFDTAVNMGVKTAIKILQEASGFQGSDVDGKFGPKTMVASFHCTKEKYALYRIFRYINIVDNNPTQLKFIEGWKNRVQQIVENKDL